MKILVVDDEALLVKGIRFNLQKLQIFRSFKRLRYKGNRDRNGVFESSRIHYDCHNRLFAVAYRIRLQFIGNYKRIKIRTEIILVEHNKHNLFVCINPFKA